MEETDIGHKSVCKYFDAEVVWVEDIRLLPHGETEINGNDKEGSADTDCSRG